MDDQFASLKKKAAKKKPGKKKAGKKKAKKLTKKQLARKERNACLTAAGTAFEKGCVLKIKGSEMCEFVCGCKEKVLPKEEVGKEGQYEGSHEW